MNRIVIHIKASDQSGIVSEYTQALSLMGINIVSLEQHVEPDDLLFFMRIEAEISKSNNITSIKSLPVSLSLALNMSLEISTRYDSNKPSFQDLNIL